MATKKPVPKQKEPEQTVGDKAKKKMPPDEDMPMGKPKSVMQKRPDEPASPKTVDRKPTKKQDPREGK